MGAEDQATDQAANNRTCDAECSSGQDADLLSTRNNQACQRSNDKTADEDRNDESSKREMSIASRPQRDRELHNKNAYP